MQSVDRVFIEGLEVDTVIGNARPSFAHLDRLVFTRRVIEESA